ncbi:hypothetical protein [Nostoc sp. FACHB-133]|uniref:hypothetical protein n=1 Tax=Nostoc sp. FACHB-133 TaxID=2692835 RepID=UPI0019B9475C|nr:hypothetical protein [Nostoc sp. FACHB-133]MBD2526652.1 hypothetical protein [Nostoc sp. FACHB-133]
MTSSTIHTDYSEDFGFDFDEQVFRPAACIVGCSKGDPRNKMQPLRGSAVAHGGNPQDRAASLYQ